jgi:hypothetical protein
MARWAPARHAQGDRAHLNAYLDDYAFLLAALIELMQTRFRLSDYGGRASSPDVLLGVRRPEGRRLSSSRATTTSSSFTAPSRARQRDTVGQTPWRRAR